MKTIKFLGAEKIEDIFSVIRRGGKKFTARDRAMVQCMYYCGLRISEVQLLHWRDWHPRSRQLWVTRLKKSFSAMIELPDKHARVLNAWMKETAYNMPDDPIFVSRTGRAMNRKSIDPLYRGYCKAAGIDKKIRNPHALRHSIAVHLINAGAEIVDIKNHLGHVNINNTMIYAQYSQVRKRRFNSIAGNSPYLAQ